MCRSNSIRRSFIAMTLLATLPLGGCMAWNVEKGGGVHLIGCTLVDELRAENQVPLDAHGVLVTHVPAHSALAGAGVRAGDVITAVNGQATPDYATFSDVTFAAGAGQPLHLAIGRGTAQQDVTIDSLPAERCSLLLFNLLFPFCGRPLDEGAATLGRSMHFAGAGFRHDSRPAADSANEPWGLLDLTLLDFGSGPDREGFMLLRSLGWDSAPGNWAVRLLCFDFGRATVVNVGGEGGDRREGYESHARVGR